MGLSKLLKLFKTFEIEKKKKKKMTERERRRLRLIKRTLAVYRVLDDDVDAVLKRRCPDRPHGRAWETMSKTFFAEDATAHLRTVFRVPYRLFTKIVKDLSEHNAAFWVQRPNAAGRVGVSTEMKVLAALKVLGHGSSAASLEAEFQIGEALALRCLNNFVDDVLALYEDDVFSTLKDAKKLKDSMKRSFEKHRVPGYVGSLDCVHVVWTMCPIAIQGSHKGRYKFPTFNNEASCDSSLRFLHFYAGAPGNLNDLSVLRQGSFVSLLKQLPKVDIVVGGSSFNFPFFFTDGIYPPWAVLVKAPRVARSEAEGKFIKKQESVRKDIERAFGILKSRFKILKFGLAFKKSSKCVKIIRTCAVLHNLIIDNQDKGIDAEQALVQDGIPLEDHLEELDPLFERVQGEDQEVEEGDKEGNNADVEESFWFLNSEKSAEVEKALVKHFE